MNPPLLIPLEVLKGVKEYYENYHHVKVPDSIVRSAAVLSERYINDRYLPDKAIDLLDEACSCASLASKDLAEYDGLSRKLADLIVKREEINSATDSVDYEKLAETKADILRVEARRNELQDKVDALTVTQDDLAKVIELWTGIPASKIRENRTASCGGARRSPQKEDHRPRRGCGTGSCCSAAL